MTCKNCKNCKCKNNINSEDIYMKVYEKQKHIHEFVEKERRRINKAWQINESHFNR